MSDDPRHPPAPDEPAQRPRDEAEEGASGPDAPDEEAQDAPEVRRPAPRGRLATLALRAMLAGLVLGAFALGLWLGDGGGEGGGQAGSTTSAPERVWSCSMHPQIRQNEPGMCPICGMDLIVLEEGAGSGEQSDVRVTLTERARALARLRTVKVAPLTTGHREVRLLGRISANEAGVRTVTAWTGGRIDRLHVAVTGERVRRGQVIATLYSPEIYTAHQDLITARRQLERLADSDAPVARSAAVASLQAARQRLSLLGVPGGELEKMEQADQPWRQVRILSPYSGTVTERLIDAGRFVQPGGAIYRVADLGTIWVQLDAYEGDLPMIHKGQRVRLEVAGLPEETFEGEVAFVDPVLDPRRRTAQVRVELPNEDGRLRPGMFAEATVEVELDSNSPPPLMIPATAPLFSGRRSLVYVEVPGSEQLTYEAREVRLGPRRGEHFPVIAGLEPGERVVVEGAFKLDADLQIQGGRSLMTRGDDTTPSAYDKIVEQLPEEGRRALAPVVTSLLDAQEALAADDLQAARAHIAQMVAQAREVKLEGAAGSAWGPIQGRLLAHGVHFARASELTAARVIFEDLSASGEELLQRFGNPLDREIRVAFCPMAFDNRGGRWLQRAEEVNNTYFGSQMLRCGEVQEEIPARSYMPDLEPGNEPAPAPELDPRALDAVIDKADPAAPRRPEAPTPDKAAGDKGGDKAAPRPSPKPASAPGSSPASAPGSKPSSGPGSSPASTPASKPAGGQP